MKTTLLVLLSIASLSFAQSHPSASAEGIANAKFSYLNKVVGITAEYAKSKEISATETLIDFGRGVTARFLTAQIAKLNPRKTTIVYALVKSFDGDAINIVILGNHVGYDINRRPVYSWQEHGDK